MPVASAHAQAGCVDKQPGSAVVRVLSNNTMAMKDDDNEMQVVAHAGCIDTCARYINKHPGSGVVHVLSNMTTMKDDAAMSTRKKSHAIVA